MSLDLFWAATKYFRILKFSGRATVAFIVLIVYRGAKYPGYFAPLGKWQAEQNIVGKFAPGAKFLGGAKIPSRRSDEPVFTRSRCLALLHPELLTLSIIDEFCEIPFPWVFQRTENDGATHFRSSIWVFRIQFFGNEASFLWYWQEKILILRSPKSNFVRKLCHFKANIIFLCRLQHTF